MRTSAALHENTPLSNSPRANTCSLDLKGGREPAVRAEGSVPRATAKKGTIEFSQQ